MSNLYDLISKKINNSTVKNMVWNMIASGVNASEAVVVLMVANRVLGLHDCGVLTFSFTFANLMMCIGKYGVRNFQVSDENNKYEIIDYFNSRVITLIFELIVAIALLTMLFIFKINALYDLMVYFVVVCVYAVEVAEDIFLANFQKKGRLDIGTKLFSIRWVITIVVWGISILLVQQLLLACILALLADVGIFVVCFVAVYSKEIELKNKSGKKWRGIIYECFPLFISALLLLYIPNASKIFININQSQEIQACYGFIAMPIFVMDVISFIIFQPMVKRMSVLWCESRIKEIILIVVKIVSLIIILTLIAICICYAYGTQLLSIIFGTDLSNYRQELIIIMIASGMLGIMGLFLTIITIVRKQKWAMISLIISALTTMIGYWLVGKMGVTGAALLNIIILPVPVLIMGCVFFLTLIGKNK